MLYKPMPILQPIHACKIEVQEECGLIWNSLSTYCTSGNEMECELNNL